MLRSFAISKNSQILAGAARWGWVLIVLALMGAVFLRVQSGDSLSVDLIQLLPIDDRSPAVERVVKERREVFERRIILLVGTNELDQAFEAARLVEEAFPVSLGFTPVRSSGQVDQKERFSFFVEHRHGLIDRHMSQLLKQGDVDDITTQVVRRYSDPSTILTSQLVRADPLLLLPPYLADAFPVSPENLRIEDGRGFFEYEGRVYVALAFSLSRSPFSIDMQEAFQMALAQAHLDLTQFSPETTLWSAGVVRHAAKGTETAMAEISTVGLGSLVGVIALVLFVFRSSLPLVASLLSIGVGALAGFASCLFIFGNVHLLTLVFGGSLVGISVDYVFHYFCERAGPDGNVSGNEALSRVWVGITLGLVTTLIGFVGMWIAPFPGLRQMATFSGVGLTASYITVCLWFPRLSRGLRPVAPGPYQGVQRYLAFWRDLPRTPIIIVAVGMTFLSLLGITQLEPQDDVRLFQSLSRDLLAEQEQITDVVGERSVSQFLLVEGRTTEELLRRSEVLTERLRAMGKSDFVTLSDFVPSVNTQKEHRALVSAYLDAPGVIEELEGRVGLTAEIVDNYLQSIAMTRAPVTLDQWLDDDVSISFRDLYLGEWEGVYRSAVTLRSISDIGAFEKLASDLEGVEFVDTAGSYSRLFAQYREQVMVLAMFSYLLVMTLLAWRYGVKGMAAVMAAPFLAAIVSLGVIGFVGGTFSLFHIMALILVLGISVDYGIFFREAGPESATTLLAVVLSALTTILAFGLLAFSSTAAIQAFGTTIFVGIAISLLVSPVAGVSLRGGGENGKY